MTCLRSIFLAIGCVVAAGPITAAATEIRVGSKMFTESVILGEIIAQLGRARGLVVRYRQELGGTQILFNALVNGDIDVYPEYTGTLQAEILADHDVKDASQMRAVLSRMGVTMSEPLGFSNNYVLGMMAQRAQALQVECISDLRDHVELRLGFSNEFMDRQDGWPTLQDRYRLDHRNVRGLDHAIAYRGLADGSIDVTDLYSTDAEIEYYGLTRLRDDLQHFTDYSAVLLYRSDLSRRAPSMVDAIKQLQGAIDEQRMIAMNKRAKIDRQPEATVSSAFLTEVLKIETHGGRILATKRTGLAGIVWEHISLVLISMIPAVLVAIPLGVLAAKRPRWSHPILAIVGIIQTIPALALLVLLMTALKPFRAWGIQSLGEPPAIVALFLYSLLPIVRNTYTGLREISPSLRESAEALGLTPFARLRLIELPLASTMMLAGIKTATVINIGFATLGALIGAGGLCQPILTGIRLDDTGLILQGAIPAALLAVAAQGLFEIVDRVCVPEGLRLGSTG